jgi:hypothetical protein
VVVALVGGIIGPRRNRLQAAIAKSTGPLPRDVQTELRQPLLLASLRFRAALIVGLVFDMTARPDSDSVLVSAAIALIGIVLSLRAWRSRHARISEFGF